MNFSVNATMEFIRHYHNSCQGDVFSVMEVRIVLQDVFFPQDRSFKDTKSSVKSQFSQVIDQGRSSVK